MISNPASRIGLFSPTSSVAAPMAGSFLVLATLMLSRGMRVKDSCGVEGKGKEERREEREKDREKEKDIIYTVCHMLISHFVPTKPHETTITVCTLKCV